MAVARVGRDGHRRRWSTAWAESSILGGTLLRLFQNGYVGTYAFFLVVGVLVLLAAAR